MKKSGKITFLLFIAVSLCVCTKAQISTGKIVFERKTNLYKKFKGNDVKEWLQEEDKNKVDLFELYFTDSTCVFQPQESDLREKMSWATSKNIVYQKLNQNLRLTIKNVWGELLYIEDTLYKRQWKITDSKRTIAGYNCRKAIWQANDTTRIYAWYTDAIIATVGPESFNGLPGAILGLASEDGGVIYFAKSVELTIPKMELYIPKKGKNKIYTNAELRTKLEKDFGKRPWGKQMISGIFDVW
jgi:GLPGLI family protein